MKILNGRDLADFIKERQATQAAALKSQGITPHLCIIYDNPSPVIAKYIELKKQYGADIGVKVTDVKANSAAEIAATIDQADQNPAIHGIILQLPIKDRTETDTLTAKIAPEKDVDGLSGAPGAYDSATATAINWLLAGYDINLQGKKIAIVGRGKLVGAPLYQMWQASNYDVTLFHRGKDLTKLNQFDIMVTATGVPGLITPDLVKPNAVLIDAGTASENGVIKGDLSPEVREITTLTAITPQTGGVGPLTVTCLFDHLLHAASQADE